MWYLVAIVVVAGVLMWVLGRGREPEQGRPVDDVSEAGLHLGDRVVPWGSVFDVRVNTRRSIGRTWFGFDVLTEDAGPLSVDGDGGRGERFLSHSHQLAGFDHEAVQTALTARRSGVVCYNR